MGSPSPSVPSRDTRIGLRGLLIPETRRRVSGAGHGDSAREWQAGQACAPYREGCRPPVNSFMFCPAALRTAGRVARPAVRASADSTQQRLAIVTDRIVTDRLDSLLKFHPFTRLNALLGDVPPGEPALAFSVGEPQAQPPAFLAELLERHKAEWSRYPQS